MESDRGTGQDASGNDGSAATDSRVTPNVDSSGGDASAEADAARDADASSCAAKYPSNAPPGHCSIGTRCNYDEGRCECADYCGGPAPPPGDNSHWVCTAKVDNGCPDPAPQNGQACTMPGASCSYGLCCVETFTCTQGRTWVSGGIACPP